VHADGKPAAVGPGAELSGRAVEEVDERREALGMTKAELARRADIAPEAVRRLFSADNPNPTIGTLTAIADTLGLELVPRERQVV